MFYQLEFAYDLWNYYITKKTLILYINILKKNWWVINVNINLRFYDWKVKLYNNKY